MAQVSAATPTLSFFRDRDLFVHDGTKLRRFRLSAPVQGFFFILLVMLVAWSGYSAMRLFAPASAPLTASVSARASADIARLAAATELRVQQIEQRQKVLTAMMAGEKVGSEVIAQLGYTLPRPGEEGRGGPFDASSKADPTFKSLFTSWKKLDNIADKAIAVPSDKPVRLASFQSAFGERTDPFERRRRMHAGIDLAAPVGTPVYATADGTVSDAGWNNGGYGKLIKVDHGSGIETRYGHLSSILVAPGQRVTRGQQIGRMGSTGRSTGSHLHYEVRIGGNAVNPIPFMRSTDYLVAMQKAAGASHSMDAVAIGGPKR